MPRSLVAAVAQRLMEATASTAAQVSEQVLAEVVEQLNADASFLRRNDQGLRASVLVTSGHRDPTLQTPTRSQLSTSPVLTRYSRWVNSARSRS